DDTVAGNAGLLHAKLGAAVLDVHVELLKRVFVHQKLNAFARRQLALAVLAVDAGLTTAQAGLVAALFELFDDVFHGVRDPRYSLGEWNRLGSLAWPGAGANGQLVARC